MTGHTSPKVVDNWMEAPEAISREDQKPLGARSVTTAWAKQSKNGFIIRLRRKLNKTRDAVAEVHLLHNRSTQHKPRQNRVEFVENYLMAFPPPKEHLHSELDSLSFKELEANSDYPPSELPGSRPNSPSELSANTEENSPSFSTHLSSLPLQRGYGTIDERLEAASPYTVSLSQPLSSLLENAPQYSDGVSPVASAHVTSDGPPSESEAGNVRPQTDEDTEAREDQGYMHSSEPQVGDGASSIAIQSRSAADEERPKAQATVDFTRMTQGLVDEDPSCEIGGRTTLVRGLSVTRTKRYETSTDAEPESPSREVAPNRTQDDTQDTSAAPLLPVKDDSGSAHLTVRSPDDFTILGHKPQYLTKDASIEHLWTALLQGQVLILGLENPLVYEAKHQLALSRRVQHQDVGLLRALDDTRENAETTLGRTHPLVGTFNSNLDLLRTAIMEEADGEKGALDLGKNKSLASPREHFSTNSPLEEDIPRPLFHANPLRQKSSSLEAQSSNRVENPQSSAPDRNVDDLDKPNKNPEEDDKNGVSEANLVESPEQDLQANTPSAASEPLDVENSENAAAKSEKTPELPSATNPRGPDNTIATLHDDQSDLNGLVIEKRRSLLGTIEESPGEADELTDSPQVAGISNKPRESLDIFNTINHRTRYASLSRGMNGRHRYLKMRPRTEFQESRGPQYSMLRPPNTKMDGPAIDSKIRLRTEQVNKVYTPSSESVPQKIEDWFNTSRPPHQIRDHRIATLRVSVAASVRVLLNALFWLLRSFGPEAVVPDGKVRVRWTCVSHMPLC
ncbi:MAG: hypothetical protein M1822_006268 [Bathelium mastoideum]|nr:MAG: hypothetical protein M1822_006268 [Bathelium mastoideum]